MPTYTYRCEKCKATFDRVETISEHEKARPRCPKCGSQKVTRVPRLFYVIASKKT